MSGFRKPERASLMSSNDIAIRVQNLSKCFEIYASPRDRLKQFIMPRIRRFAGKAHTQYYREFWALKDVSFEIKKGETVGIIGRNGSGKSTLLQMICGTLTPTNGSIETNGRIAALLELGSGFNPEFTGRENVYMNAAVLGLTNDEIDARFDDIAAFADIGDFIEQPVKTYSSGMFVRLAFAIQANVDPEILIVDEALAVGDVFFVHRCMSRFHELKNRGTTILLVSHDSTAIKTLCDSAIWLKNGRMKKIGNADVVVDAYLADDYEFQTGIIACNGTSSDKKIDIITAPSYQPLTPTSRQGNGVLVVEGGALLNSDKSQADQISPNHPISLVLSLKNHALPSGSALIVGYALRNIRGIDIASNNNEIEGAEIVAPEQGCSLNVEIIFKLPYLHPGQYAISISVGSRDKLGIMQGLDLLENALRFDMLEVKKCHVLMTLESAYSCTFSQ
jgi:lipopolysaccharide transport system ATP-binding protein